MQSLQNLIHKLEVGEGRRYVAITAGILIFLGVLALYNLREASGFASIEAMDNAQVARNLAEGRGFSTYFLRPLSLKIVGERRKEVREDPMMLDGDHPDLANAPLYPCLLSAAMKVLPFDFKISPFQAERFRRFQPEVLIGAVNQIFFILSAVVLFRLAKRLFDAPVACFAVVVFLGTDILWRFCFSGLSTNLAILLLLLLVSCLVKMESRREAEGTKEGATDSARNFYFYFGMSVVCGLLLGCLMLTRYSLGWLAIPVAGFFVFYLPGKRLLTIGVALLVFGIVVMPWLGRNYQLSGHFWGTAGYAHWQDSARYPDTHLERTLQGELSSVSLRGKIQKLLANSGEIIENELPKLGGSLLSAFFWVGLLVPFENRRLNRLRIFAVLALITLTVAQALGQTHLSRHSPEINSQNLVILLLPLVYVFGAGLFFLLLDRLKLSFFGAQYYASFLVAFLACLPLIFRFLPPRDNPIVYPPYSPHHIQQIGHWFEADELIMSDMPWAVGWYGGRKCLWLTQSPDSLDDDDDFSDFYAIHDVHKSINGLYLTPITTNSNFLEEVILNSTATGVWGRLYMDVYLDSRRKRRSDPLPKGFPLQYAADKGFLPDQLFLTDWQRWNLDE